MSAKTKKFTPRLQPRLPARVEQPRPTRLYGLPPEGLGTPDVESLAGYIARLAEAHRNAPSVLMEQEILPALGKEYLMDRQRSTVQGFLSTSGVAINGMGATALEMAAALSKLTGQEGHECLTMLQWRNVVSKMLLLRRIRAWCPYCLWEMRESQSGLVYEKLLWSLNMVSVCLRHGTPVVDKCPAPNCGRQMLPLNLYTRPGYCSACGGWLGLRPNVTELEGPMSVAARVLLKETEYLDEQEWLVWIAQATGEMLASTLTMTQVPPPDRAMAAFKAYLGPIHKGRYIQRGRLADMIRNLELPEWTLRAVYAGETLPQLGTLMQLAYALTTTPLVFLTGDPAQVPQHRMMLRPLYPHQVTRVVRRDTRIPIDREETAEQLTAVLQREDAPSLVQVAQGMGYDQSVLRRVHPELCKAISARYKADRRAKKVAQVAHAVEEVRLVTLALASEGCAPTSTAVVERISNPGLLRIPEVYTAWRKAVDEVSHSA